jgi:uncharacterized membrane protein
MSGSDASSLPTAADPEGATPHRSPTIPASLRSVATDPARCFLVLGMLVGLLLVFIVEPMGGIDEAAHFVRAYQVSTGRLIPQIPAEKGNGTGTAGACIPKDVQLGVAKLLYENYFRREGGQPDPNAKLAGHPSPDCSHGDRFFDFSAFGWYSAVAYLPQAAAIAVGRALGVGVPGLDLLTRLANLAVYLALVYTAIRRSPFARWGLCVVALLPVSLFQVATSRSPDTITIAVGMLVVVSALRAVQGGTSTADGGSSLVERIVLCALLGVLKPTYALPLSLCFLLPLWVRPRRERLRTLLAPIGVAFASAALWQAFFGHYFTCDTPLFLNWRPDKDEQITTILHSPFTYVVNLLGSMGDHAGLWVHQAFTVEPIFANWAWPALALALVGCFVAGARRDATENFELRWPQRTLLLGLAFVGAALVITGEHVYCAPIGLDLVYPPHARHFLPILPLLAVGLTPSHRSGKSRSWTDRIPSAAMLLVLLASYVVSTALEMR